VVRLLLPVFALFVALAAALPDGSVKAAAYVYQVDMHGTDQIPPVSTNAWGFVRFFFSDDRNSADYTVDVKGVSGSIVTGADIRRGQRGVNGPVVYHLADAGFIVASGHINFRPGDIEDMMAGNWYATLSTATNPGGELRGQIFLPANVRDPAPSANQLRVPLQTIIDLVSAQGAPALLAPTISCGQQVSATLRWRALPGPSGQWVDISKEDNGFLEGTFFGAGPLSAEVPALIVNDLEPGVDYYWRVNALTSVGWITSATSNFVTC
jgi:CHRD domain